VAALCQSLLRNSHNVHPVSTLVRGQYGLSGDVFLSLPCVLGAQGVEQIVSMSLTDEEKDMLHRSASAMSAVQSELQI